MGDDKRQNAFCTATHETLKQANPLLVNGLPEKQERKWVRWSKTAQVSRLGRVARVLVALGEEQPS